MSSQAAGVRGPVNSITPISITPTSITPTSASPTIRHQVTYRPRDTYREKYAEADVRRKFQEVSDFFDKCLCGNGQGLLGERIVICISQHLALASLRKEDLTPVENWLPQMVSRILFNLSTEVVPAILVRCIKEGLTDDEVRAAQETIAESFLEKHHHEMMSLGKDILELCLQRGKHK